ncbi:MAG: hypothetical protein U1F56_06100 [Rubrivivax sp.]
MAIPSFSSTVVARAAAAIYGLQLGNGTMTMVLDEANASGGVDKLINSVYNRDFASVSNADVAAMVVANLGITGAGVADAVAYVKGQIDAAGAANEGAAIANAAALFSGLTAHATYGAAATAFNNRIAAAVAYAQQAGTSDRAFNAGATIALTRGQDFLTGTAGNDTIIARIFDNGNTLQSGDWVDGGAGTDRLEADMGSSQSFSVTPETVNVETFSVRAQSRAFDSGDNNPAAEGLVNVDAQRMAGVTRFDSTDSRADVIIEDVRTPLRTKDITIGMIGTDAGNVDYAVYFDKLRADGTTTASLEIELMDTRAATNADPAIAALPLKDSPYNGFSFRVNGQLITLRDAVPNSTDVTTFNGAQTYPQLLAAIQKMLTLPANLAQYPALASITASLGGTFEARDTKTGAVAIGQKIVLSGSSASAVTLAVGNFIADDGVPADSGLHTVQTVGTTSSTDLITSTAVLDNVGRGSNGGDLVIGAMSVGETSTSAGIARFEITVENTSNLGIIASTNNALKEVTFANGTVKGNVTVKGTDNNLSITSSTTATNGASGINDGVFNNYLPGATAQHNGFGFNDVRLIDASAMTGTVGFDAAVTTASFAKYHITNDTGADPATDNDSTDGKTTRQVADFDYQGGAGGDTINVVVAETVAGSHSNVQPGREDFTFSIKGNGGNDAISFRMDRAADGTVAAGGLQNWYEHQKMNQELNLADRDNVGQVYISGGDGNDTVRKLGSGDVNIDLGAGNDTAYTDNTGSQSTAAIAQATALGNSGRAIWVFNTTDQDPAAVLPAARDIDNLESDDNDHYFMYKAVLTVTYRGVENKTPVTIGSLPGSYLTTDLHINQAIKAAINNDPVLAKVLVARDGPANSLIVNSLIDGDFDETDLSVDIELPDDLSTTDVNALLKAWDDELDDGGYDNDEGGIFDLMDDELADWDATTDYDTALANDGAADRTGADSVITTTDNLIEGGTGDDVIALSTTVTDNDVDEDVDLMESSNETIVYTGAFGNDTIFNFGADGYLDVDDAGDDDAADDTLTDGEDQLDFTALGGDTFAGFLNDTPDDGDIMVDDQLDDTDGDGNPIAPDIDDVIDLFTDDDTADRDVDAIYIEVQSSNVGYVYHVTDGEDDNDLEVEFLGTIDLADTDWFDLTAANFAG